MDDLFVCHQPLPDDGRRDRRVMRDCGDGTGVGIFAHAPDVQVIDARIGCFGRANDFPDDWMVHFSVQ
ncbi:MAG: hypothetical protein LBP99_03550 [Azoarcus sp.]|nr:hypothetical protein [Azoarcus sp.]